MFFEKEKNNDPNVKKPDIFNDPVLNEMMDEMLKINKFEKI